MHAFVHITGGGLAATWPGSSRRTATPVDRSTWTPPPVFDLVGTTGAVEQLEMEKTLNMGVGMIAVVAPDDADAAVDVLTARGVTAWVAGEIVGGDGTAELVGAYRALTDVLCRRSDCATLRA